MKCYLCNKTALIELQKNRSMCNECFCRLLEKRIRKDARINKIFSKNDRILIIGELNKYLVKSIIKELPVKLFFRAKIDKEFVKKNKINKIVINWTLDDEIHEFLKDFFADKMTAGTGKKYIKLLRKITDKEAELFVKIKKLKFKKNKKDKHIEKFLQGLEKDHPEIRYTLFRNIKKLVSI